MAEKDEVTRRDFLKGLGVGIAAGAAIASGVAIAEWPKPAKPITVTKTATETVTKTVAPPLALPIKAGVVVHDPSKCVGCGTCQLVCSYFHEGVFSQSLSRIRMGFDPINGTPEWYLCKQCDAPSCYYACPLKDEALCIDEKTGARYINREKCIKCGKCIEACPFEPPNIKWNKKYDLIFKCDLGMKLGFPQCVKYCPTHALSYITKEDREKEYEEPKKEVAKEFYPASIIASMIEER